jgi:hypothetical protein
MNDSTLAQATHDRTLDPRASSTRSPGIRAAARATWPSPWAGTTPQLKRDVRRLKELGLTHSLDAGYELCPLGRAYINDPYEPRSR